MLLKEGRYFGIHPKFETSVAHDEELMTKPFFWTEHVLKLFGHNAVEKIYPTLNSEATVYYDVVKLCLRLLESRAETSSPGNKPATPRDRGIERRLSTLNKNAFMQPGLQTQSTGLLVQSRPRGETAHLVELNASIVKQSSEVLDTFENDKQVSSSASDRRGQRFDSGSSPHPQLNLGPDQALATTVALPCTLPMPPHPVALTLPLPLFLAEPRPSTWC